MMSANEIIYVSLGVIVVVCLVIWSFVRHAQTDKKIKQFLIDKKFKACDELKKKLAEQIAHLENNSEYHYSVEMPMKTRRDGIDLFFFIKHRKDKSSREDIYSAYTLLFSINRQPNLPFKMLFKPSTIKEGLATRMLRSITTGPWKSQPDDFVKISLPPHLQQTNILGITAPEKTKFNDLFDSAAISILSQAGDHDIFQIQYRDTLCAIEQPASHYKWDFEKTWSFVAILIRKGL